MGPDGRIALVEQKYQAWSLPKGHVDPGETDEQAAIREIYEETGLEQVELVRPLGEYERYKIAKDGGDDTSERKTIVIFLFRTTETKLAPIDPHNPQAQWIHKDDVVDRLTHKADKAFFERIKHVL